MSCPNHWATFLKKEKFFINLKNTIFLNIIYEKTITKLMHSYGDYDICSIYRRTKIWC